MCFVVVTFTCLLLLYQSLVELVELDFHSGIILTCDKKKIFCDREFFTVGR